MQRLIPITSISIFLLLSVSCKQYKSNIMFTVPEGWESSTNFKSDSSSQIEPFDLVEIRIYNKSGETLVDPEFQLQKDNAAQGQNREHLIYRVNERGFLNLPMVGDIQVSGLSLEQARLKISEAYTTYYDHLFIYIRFQNKRVMVLGATGGMVIPLTNENMTLVEGISLAGGIPVNGRADNIRWIRGEDVKIVDLSTFKGYNEGKTPLKSGDIIYIEPVRKPFTEGLRENSPIIGIISGLASLTAIIISVTN